MARATPSIAAWLLTALYAVAVAAAVYRIPIQVSDSLEILEDVDQTPSLGAAFIQGLRASQTMLRPLRQVQTKALLNVAHAMGDRYHLVFRGSHAITAGVLILLFTCAARPRTWRDVAALAFALTVLTGLHTFAGMVREAYPINHFLLIALYCLAVLVLSQSRGGAAVDVSAVVCVTLAVMTLESGMLVWVVAAAGYVAGNRGISRWALATMTLVGITYMWLRVGVLTMSPSALGDRQTGFGLSMLSTAEQQARFGNVPWVLYTYTVVGSALSVLFSQPSVGVWTAVQAWQTDRFTPVYLIEISTSIAGTALIAWYLLERAQPGEPRRWRTPTGTVALAVLVANAAVSYAYAKAEIMSAAGVFYALLAFYAAAEALPRLSRRTVGWSLAPTIVVMLLISGGWAVRSLGLQYKLQRSAYAARTEWVEDMPPYRRAPERAGGLRLAPRLRQEALFHGRTNPFMLPRWTSAYWGDE